MSEFTVLALTGSLRKLSYNRALVSAAVELAPPGMRIVPFDRLGELPLYNADLDVQDGPEPVEALKAAIRGANALLFSTPEYNYGIPAPLKNAVDWASRPPTTTPLKSKPALIIGASTGAGGTVRAQAALRQAFVFTQTYPLSGPEFALGNCADKFDSTLRLRDEKTRAFLASRLAAFMEYAKKLGG